MNMFNLVSRFWRIAEEGAFTPSEAALYFYLLHRANAQKWKMPIRCPTSIICTFLCTTKQNVIKAREGLKQRGLIAYIPGSGTNGFPLYTLLETTDRLSSQLSPQLSGELSGQLLPYYNKEEDKDNSKHNTHASCVLKLDELEKMFLEDDEWQESIINLLLVRNIKGATNEILRNYISQFFQYLTASGQNERNINDCKNHFINWLIKQHNNNRNETHKSQHQDRRTSSDVSHATTEAYHEAF